MYNIDWIKKTSFGTETLQKVDASRGTELLQTPFPDLTTLIDLLSNGSATQTKRPPVGGGDSTAVDSPPRWC